MQQLPSTVSSHISPNDKEALIIKLTKALQIQNARVEELKQISKKGMCFIFQFKKISDKLLYLLVRRKRDLL